MRRRYLVAVGAAAAAGLAIGLAITDTSLDAVLNYMPAPTIACLRAQGFAISWESPPYRFRQARNWASVGISRDGRSLSVIFAPSPALARVMASTSGFSLTNPWIRRNVVFSSHADPEDGPIVGCLASGRRK